MWKARKVSLRTWALLLVVISVRAQDVTAPRASDMKIKAELRPAHETPRIWITPEYVHYWQNTTTKLPELLSIADPTDSFPVGSYYGNKGISWNDGNGVKLTVGAWIDEQKHFGVELTGFYVPKQTQSIGYNPLPGNVDGFFSDYNLGSPPHTFKLFFPTDPASSANFHYGTEQYGGEANGLVHIGEWQPVDGLKVDASGLGGFRYFGLQDSYSDALNQPNAGFFYNDYFKTDNNFYGVNLGVHARFEYKSFFAEVTPKIALGATDESVGVNGSNTVPAVPGPGGFYASGNKLGQRTSTPFAYLPQITIKLGYDFSKTVEAFIGYDALYLSDVARVENQISTQLDGNQIAGFNFGGGPDQSPAPGVQSSSLFEQGVTAGLTFKL
jgi:hypothetical protein